MKKETREDSFIKQPYYEGGDKALATFISSHLQYPNKSLENKIEGSVYLRYDIDIKGNVTDAKVVSGLDKHCNEEAIRVVKLLKFTVPKNPRKMRITFHKTIRIHFAINQVAQVTEMEDIVEANAMPQMPAQSLAYTIIPQVKPTISSPKPSPTIYTYTVKIG